jgi:cobalamin biosynthesis protein CobT
MQLKTINEELKDMTSQPLLAQDSLTRLTPAQMAVFASGIGRKHGIKVVFDNYSTALTDGKTVVLPLTSKENSWIIRGYLDHEVGHVRLSDLSIIPKATPFHRTLWNTLEDIRIEKEMAGLYPGMQTNFRVLISELRKHEPELFSLHDPSPDAKIAAYILLVLRSLYLKQPEMADLAIQVRDEFLATFGPHLERDLFNLLTGIEDVRDPQGIVVLVEKIVELLAQYAKEKHEPGPGEQGTEDQPTGEAMDSPSGEDDPEGAGEAEKQAGQDEQDGQSEQVPEDADAPGDADDGSQGQPNSGDQKADEGKADDQSGTDGSAGDDGACNVGTDENVTSGGDQQEPEEQTGDQHTRKAVQQALDSEIERQDLGQQLKELALKNEMQTGHRHREIWIAQPIHQERLNRHGYVPQEIKSASGVATRLSARLRGLLQAQSLKHGRPSTCGNRLARNRLHRIKTGDPKVFLRKEPVKQVDTAIHLLVDNSSSMQWQGRFPIARDVSMALIKCLASFKGVNLGVSVFPAFWPYPRDSEGRVSSIPVAQVLAHGHRPGSRLAWPYQPEGGTPLEEAVRLSLTSLLVLHEPRKILFILTDGEPDDSLQAKDAIDEALSLGIEVVTLGIEDLRDTSIFPVFEIVEDVRELPEKTFRLLERLLVN